jgi:hypothetical protein
LEAAALLPAAAAPLEAAEAVLLPAAVGERTVAEGAVESRPGDRGSRTDIRGREDTEETERRERSQRRRDTAETADREG